MEEKATFATFSPNRIPRFFFHRAFGIFLFAITTLLIFANVGIFQHIKDKPNSVHTWAQTDRASVAACYYYEDMNFFLPRVYNRGDGTNTGISGMEFPVINYMAAICYKLFGFHEMYYRLINLILLLTGLVFAFLMADIFLKDKLLSALSVWLFIMSPVLFFYSANFLPDTASLGLVLISWYLFFKLGEQPGRRKMLFFGFIITLACLIKLTSMVSFIAMLVLMAARRWRFLSHTTVPFLDRKMVILAVVSIFVVFGWYQYAAWLNDTYQNYFFILKGNAAGSVEEVRTLLTKIHHGPFQDYYLFVMKRIIAFLAVFFLVTLPYQNRVLSVTVFLLSAGYAAFVFSMLRQFQYHDYYFIPLLPLSYFLVLSFLNIMKRKFLQKRLLYVAFLVVLFIVANTSMVACKKFYRNKYYGKGYKFISYSEYDRYVQAGLYLDMLGVGKDDLVISYYDQTPNGSLYLMNRKGATIKYGDINRLNYLLATNNFKYLILNDTARFTPALYESLVPKKIGDKYKVQVYKLDN